MSMLLLNSFRSFLRKNPAYEPDLVELSAIIYILSCKMVGVKPVGNLVPVATKRRNQQSTANQK